MTLLDPAVELVGDIVAIPNSLPAPVLPDFSVAPDLVFGAVAVALVALAQAAGIGAAVPNPDGSRTNVSGDLLAQGIANVGGAFFRALPTGGSLSRTGVATSAGAQTRWAGIFAGLWLALVVVLFAGIAEIIPMAVIGGLVLVIGVELVRGRLPDIRLVLKTSKLASAAMVVTFLATTQLPLQQAIVIGAVLSLLLYCVQSARQARLVALVAEKPGRYRVASVPERLASDSVTILHYAGVSLFAEVPRIDEQWPRLDGAQRAVIILNVRTLPDVPSSTLLKVLERRARELDEHGGRLVISGAHPQLVDLLEGTGLLAVIGRDNVIPATDELFEALDEAVALASTKPPAQ